MTLGSHCNERQRQEIRLSKTRAEIKTLHKIRCRSDVDVRGVK